MRLLVTSIVDLERSAHNRLHRLLEAAPSGTEITILSLHDRWKEAQEGALAAQDLVRHNDWQIIPFAPQFASPRNQELAAIATVPAILRELDLKKFDIHVNYNSLVAGWRVSRVAARAGIPTIYDLADDLPAMVAETPFLPPWLRPVARLTATQVVRENCRLADQVTVTTPWLGRTIGIPEEKTVVLPNGVDRRLFEQGDRSEARKQFGLKSTDKVLGYVGVLREWIDFAPLFAAVGKLKDPQLVVVIAGREGDPGRIERQAKAAGVIDQVRFLGALPYADVPVFTNAIDIGLLPFSPSGITENAVPLKIFEYLAAGRPVLATPLRAVKDIFSESLWYATDAADLASNIQAILADPKTTGARVAEAQTRLPDYDWATIGARFWQLLKERGRRHG